MSKSDFYLEIYRHLNFLSFLSLGFSSPNPPVACVIFDETKRKILSLGFSEQAGKSHAELGAYNNLDYKERFLKHSLAVTLEPCSHHGKTPPCLDLILKYKPDKIIYGLRDFNPIVKKKRSIAKLKKEKHTLVVKDFYIKKKSKVYLNGFFNRLKNFRPSFLLKTVVTKDNFFSSKKNKKISISNQYSNKLTQLLRAKYDAVLVGPKTTFIDKPSLDFRGLNVMDLSYFKVIKEHFLFNTLLDSFSNNDFITFHNENISSYQPYRVFIISKASYITEDFIQIQEMLNQKYKINKLVFFLSKIEYYSDFLIRNLKKISDNKIYFFKQESVALDILKKLGNLGCNNVIVEGGNFLYKEFSKIFSSYDLFLKINSENSFKKLIHTDVGVSPSFFFEKKLNLISSFNLNQDLWEFYNCIPD